MKKILFLFMTLIFISASVSAVDRFYKQTSIEIPESGSLEVARIPVTYDLGSVMNSYIKMGFSATEPETAITDLGSSIPLVGDPASGRITGFDSTDVYAYCRVVSTVPVVISITGLSPLECSDISNAEKAEDGVINWQVYSGEGADKKVYFNGLAGQYIVPAVNFHEHNPLKDGSIMSTCVDKLSIESESFRGKIKGSYSAELIMTITSIN